jgi:broad specificity phosphatase PhoE
MTEIYVIRHGKTQFNAELRIMGHYDCPILPKSKIEAKKLGERIKKVDFDIVFSSDLSRTSETAKIIIKQLLRKPELKLVKDLREIDYGKATKMLISDAKKKFPKAHKTLAYVNPGGESFQQLYDRVINFIKKNTTNYNKVLIVTHAGCLRAIYSYFKNEDFEKNLNIKLNHEVVLKCILGKDKKEAKFC